MVIRNRVIAFIYRVCLFAFGGVSLYYLFSSAQNFNMAAWGFLSFGIETTLFAMGILLAEIIANGIGLAKGSQGLAPGVWSPLFFSALVYVLSSSLANLISAPIFLQTIFQGSQLPVTLISHLFFPIAFYLDYLLFGEKGTVKWIHPVYWVVYPIFYFAFSLVAHYIWNYGWFPYPFLDYVTYATALTPGTEIAEAWAHVWITGLVFLGSFLVFSYFIVFLNNLFAGVYRPRDHHDIN